MKLRFVPNLLILPLFAFGFFGIAHARSGDASALGVALEKNAPAQENPVCFPMEAQDVECSFFAR